MPAAGVEGVGDSRSGDLSAPCGKVQRQTTPASAGGGTMKGQELKPALAGWTVVVCAGKVARSRLLCVGPDTVLYNRFVSTFQPRFKLHANVQNVHLFLQFAQNGARHHVPARLASLGRRYMQRNKHWVGWLMLGLVTLAGSGRLATADDDSGWIKRGLPLPNFPGCYQLWECVPTSTAATADSAPDNIPVGTWGTCENMMAGEAAGCGECLAPEPDRACHADSSDSL